MTISAIGSQVSSLQAIRAQNAFTKKPTEDVQNKPTEPKQIEEKETLNFARVDNKFLKDIKTFAEQNNIADIEEEDIHYAMSYGTSLFADYSA